MHHKQLEFSVAFKAMRGARDYQEDSIKIWRPEGGEAANAARGSLLAVLSDGMGGHVSGEVASNTVCEHYVQHFATDASEPAQKLEPALVASNESLDRAIRANAKLSGMGCTVVVAYLDNEGLRWASVGDSSLLIFRNNELYRLNEDHSLGALLDKQAAARVISYEEAHNSPHRRSLRSAMTGGKIAHADIERSPQKVLPGDWVIVASDGLETLSGDEIASIIDRHGKRTPLDLVEKLLGAVDGHKSPHQDNTSVIAIRVQESDDVKTTWISPRGEAGDGRDVEAAANITEPIGPPTRGTVIGHVLAEFGAAEGHGGRTSDGRTTVVKAMLVLALLVVGCAIAYLTYSSDSDSSPSREQAQQAGSVSAPPGANAGSSIVAPASGPGAPAAATKGNAKGGTGEKNGKP